MLVTDFTGLLLHPNILGFEPEDGGSASDRWALYPRVWWVRYLKTYIIVSVWQFGRVYIFPFIFSHLCFPRLVNLSCRRSGTTVPLDLDLSMLIYSQSREVSTPYPWSYHQGYLFVGPPKKSLHVTCSGAPLVEKLSVS